MVKSIEGQMLNPLLIIDWSWHKWYRMTSGSLRSCLWSISWAHWTSRYRALEIDEIGNLTQFFLTESPLKQWAEKGGSYRAALSNFTSSWRLSSWVLLNHCEVFWASLLHCSLVSIARSEDLHQKEQRLRRRMLQLDRRSIGLAPSCCIYTCSL